MFDTQQCVTMACLLDVIAPKPGNVHRGADFEDMTFLDFAASAVAIGPVLANAAAQPIGRTVLQAIEATRVVTHANTNLGIVLLLAPLAAATATDNARAAMPGILRSLTAEDARDVFAAIRLAGAGGMGTVDEMDVNVETHPSDLMSAMELARDRDRIAEMFVTDFELIFADIVPLLVRSSSQHGVVDGMIASYIHVLARFPDTLITRKCGKAIAEEASKRAARCTEHAVGSENWVNALSELDFWLRADDNRRNPGTTADLLTAAAFISLNEQQISW